MTVGERIYYCRIENHMTQKELGEKTGIDGATIGKYERGVLNPKIGTLRKIADALGVSSFDLMPEELLDANKVDDYVKEHNLNADEIAGYYSGLANEAVSRLGEALKDAKETALIRHFRTLNDNGQRVAVERVQELAQIPAYQRPTDAVQSAAGDTGDKDPEEK